jgi:hypothetical protein
MISSAGRDQPGAQSPVGRSNTVGDLHGQLTPVYSDIARLSIDPELMKGALPMQASSIKPKNNLGIAFSMLVGLLFNAPPPARHSQGAF